MKSIRALLVLATLAWLGGCATGPDTSRHYSLPADGEAVARGAGAEASHTLVIRPLRIDPYLDGEGIVLQLDDITLNRASDHRWAEELGLQLQRGLRERLASRLADTRVLTADGEAAAPDALSLSVEVERFQGRFDGQAVASGRWRLRDGDGELLIADAFEATSELQTDGYPALVRALGRSWDRVADQLAERLRERP